MKNSIIVKITKSPEIEKISQLRFYLLMPKTETNKYILRFLKLKKVRRS